MSRYYIVQDGDTLKKISRSFTKRPKEISDYNYLRYPNAIFPGQVLQIPTWEGKTTCTEPLRKKNRNQYTVCYGDSLWSISERNLNSPSRWKEIAHLNKLSDLDHIYVGQKLFLPYDAKNIVKPPKPNCPSSSSSTSPQHRPAKMVPTRALFFVIADEFNPLKKIFVRKVIFPKELQNNVELVNTILRPDKYGFSPRAPGTNVSVGRHALGMTNSRYISMSTRPFGSPRFKGKRFWVDVDNLIKSGAKIYDSKDIIVDLNRIASKSKDPKFLKYVEYIKNLLVNVDKEVLVEGSIPPRFIKGVGSKMLTHGLQFVEGIGIVLTIYDMGKATKISYETKSPRPLVAESVLQVGGWGSALAGFEIGACVGGAFGIETGPGAILSAGVGGFIFGAAGYFGADWIAKYIYDDEKQ